MSSFQDVSLLDDAEAEESSNVSLNDGEGEVNSKPKAIEPKNVVNNSLRKISIASIEERQTSHFTKYNVYIIECDPPRMNVASVPRRYNDFKWLRNQLAQQFPGVFVPPLPPSNVFGRFKKDFLEERRCDLERFLARINAIDTFTDNVTFLMFLSRPESTFLEGKKEIDEVIATDTEVQRLCKRLQELYPKLNEMDLPLSVHSEDVPRLKDFLLRLEAQMKVLNESADKLLKNLFLVSTEMDAFSGAFANLYTTETDYPHKPELERIDIRSQLNDWSESHSEEIKGYSKVLLSLRYEQEDISAFLELFNARDTIVSQVSKAEARVQKWQTTIDGGNELTPVQQTQQESDKQDLNSLNELLTIVTKIMLNSEIEQIWTAKADVWRTEILEFAQLEMGLSDKMLNGWKSVAKN